MKHYCHNPDCKKIVPRKMLMCSKCWAKVPEELQSNVYKAFFRQHKSREAFLGYLRAARYAINAVTGQGVQWPDKLPY